jgi:hypothetical protein
MNADFLKGWIVASFFYLGLFAVVFYILESM